MIPIFMFLVKILSIPLGLLARLIWWFIVLLFTFKSNSKIWLWNNQEIDWDIKPDPWVRDYYYYNPIDWYLFRKDNYVKLVEGPMGLNYIN